ncbi:MAG: roadblock/LC7 domain-containing protein [Gammaproteobacteria bacterium]|nr:roadblock/LC7 domain-containing protein [Gammaproteobacteria bacterium]
MDDDEHLVVINLTPAQLDQSEQKLAELIRVCPGAYGAIISTIDGHNILHSLKRDIPFNKISTMTSSLLALGESISRESEQRLCQFVILENSNGRVVSLRINDFLMLTCISTKDSNLGMLLSAGRNTADALNELLRS